MGVVYKAVDEKLDRIVAIKFLPPHLINNKEIKERFLREAKALSKLDHPNICVIHEIGETEDDRVFIVMNYYEGETLDKKIKKKSLKRDDTIEIIFQIARGLLEAHKNGIIHRDIKPSNIIITKNNIVKILDFGLAKFIGESRLTKNQEFIGTIFYMSPEQTRGEKIDFRTDIWSLGVLMYEMLTGELPFKGEYEQAVIYSILNEDPPEMKLYNDDIPEQLNNIVKKCLQKKPEERYETIDHLIKDLTNYTRSKTFSKKTHDFSNFFLKFISSIFDKKRSSVKEEDKIEKDFVKNSIAVLPFEDKSPAQDQSFFCEGMTDDIITRLSKIKELKVINILSVLRYKNVQKSIKEIGKELGVENILMGSIRKVENQVKINVQLIKTSNEFNLWGDSFSFKMKEVFKVQEFVAEKIAETLEQKFSKEIFTEFRKEYFNNLEMYEYSMKAKSFINNFLISGKEDDFKQAIKMLKRMLEIEPNNPLTHMYYAWCYQNHFSLSGKFEELRYVAKYVKTAYRLNPNLPQTLAGMGWLHVLSKDFKKAFPYYKKALKKGWGFPEITHVTGLFYQKLGLYEKAVYFFKKSYERNPFYLFAVKLLSNCYEEMGEWEKADHYYKKSIEIAPKNSLLSIDYANFLLKKEKIKKAKDLFNSLSEKEKRKASFLLAQFLAIEGNEEKALKISQKPEIYSLLGKTDEAILSLQKRKGKEPKYSYLSLKNNPHFNLLRGDPVFESILEEQKGEYEKLMKIYGGLK